MQGVWGCVVLCGRISADEAGHDHVGPAECVYTPHILRSVSHIRMQHVITSCVADHAVFVSARGDAYVYGRNREGQCGRGAAWLYDAKVLDKQHDFVPPLAANETILTGATGAAHTLLVTSHGAVYAAGQHTHGECGLGKSAGPTIAPFHRVSMPEEVRSVACGRGFSVMAGASGRVYAMGTQASGVLGVGTDGAYYAGPSSVRYRSVWEPVALSLSHIQHVACGEQHAAALDHEGYVYVWGEGSLARLGCGTQSNQCAPVRIPQFVRKHKHDRIHTLVCGRTSTVCIDHAHRLWVAGTWRAYGDGGANQSFLIYKPLQEFVEYDVHAAVAGADVFQCLVTPTSRAMDARTQVWAWGEQAWHAELGARVAPPDPEMLEVVRQLHVVAIASGRHTSFWLVRPEDDAYADLPRYPAVMDSSSVCMVCRREDVGDEDGSATLLECGRCEDPVHLGCHDPPLRAVPKGEWLCPTCARVDPEPAADTAPRKRQRT